MKFTLTISDTKAGLPDCVYDQMIVPLYFCSDTLDLDPSLEGRETIDRKEIRATHHTIMFIISLSLMLSL